MTLPRKAGKEITVKPRKKVNRKVKPETKTEAVKTASASTPTATARPSVLKVLKKDAKFRGSTAREAWFTRLVEFDGKPEGEYIESCRKNPPSLTGNGTAENPSGWVRFFERQGVVSKSAGA